MNKQESHIVTGMSRDISVNQFNSKLVYDAHNIRVTSRDGNSTLLSVSNERGTKKIELDNPIVGVPIGHAVLNDYLILFTTTNNGEIHESTDTDHIYRIEPVNVETAKCVELLTGNMNFSALYPIETLPLYENNDIQKVYWVDGRNQPRVINVVDKTLTEESNTRTDIIEFSRDVELKHTFSVTKRNTGGLFPAGTVQYAFSYFNKFGQETKIFDFTPLYYLSPKERGLQADQTSSCSFLVDIKNLDANFQYVRVYSIVRSSANATPACRIVGDFPIDIRHKPAIIGKLSLIDDRNNEIRQNAPVESLYIYNEHDYSLIDLRSHTEAYGGNAEINGYILSLEEWEYLVDVTQSKVFKSNFDLQIYDYYNRGYYTLKALDNSVAEGDTQGRLYEASYIPGTQAREVSLVDNGTYGSTIDANALLFVGGENIVASTIAQKDNTLFLGNIKLNKPNIGQLSIGDANLKEYVRSASSKENIIPVKLDYYGKLSTEDGAGKYNPTKNDYYNYSIDNNRNSQQVKRFKSGEVYRLGLMAQYKDGSWSEVLWLGDMENDITPELDNGTYLTGAWKYKLSNDMVQLLKDNNFKRVAPVVVYPSLADRNVVCQGIIVPTVYNVGDRATNSPFVQSSWFIRQSSNLEAVGTPTGFIGLHNTSIDNEIQTSLNTRELRGPVVFESEENPYGNPNIQMTAATPSDFINNYNEAFMVDESILTFHSPDIEFNDSIGQSEFDGLKVRLVGMSFLMDGKAKYYITLDSIGIADASKIVKGGDWTFAYTVDSYNKYNGRINNSNTHPGMFADGAVNPDDTTNVSILSAQDEIYGWCVYPWHRNGSLNNQGRLSTTQAKNGFSRTAMLKHKILSRLSYARTAYGVFNTINLSTRDPQLFNSDQMSAIKIPAPANSGLNNLVYYGNIDKVLTPNYVNLSGKYRANYDEDPTGVNLYRLLSIDKTVGYPINYLWFKYIGTDATRKADAWSMANRSEVSLMEQNGTGSSAGNPLTGSTWVVWKDRWTNVDGSSKHFLGKDPVSMKYKSTPHAVIALDYEMMSVQVGTELVEKPVQMILPRKGYGIIDYKAQPFWENATQYFKPYDMEYTEKYTNAYGGGPSVGIFIAELYRDNVDNNSRFGGNTDTALASNMWIKCGDAVSLDETNPTIVFKEGDTYLERYDCLKTYPYTNEDTNSIIEIYSTEVETRVNLDERTDRNRGLTDNSAITRQNFNLFNHAGYEQDSNFFNFQALDYARVQSLYYPNMVTWSLQKTLGEDIDKWTSIDLTSTIDLDGDKGEVTSLNMLNNEIFAFQRRGFAQLLFNSRVQIPTSDGQPIEITNGLKMQGKRYLSSLIGCTNKWSIQETPNGLYFLDDESNTLYRFSGSLEDISTKCGMKSWLDEHNSLAVWNPVEFNNIITFYDRTNADLYFVAKNWCLVYSEQLGQFTSFMDYNGVPVMAGVRDHFISVKNDSLWKMFSGDYNSFFGETKPYWLTFIANDNPTMDKVFNNLEFRADMWDGDTLKPLETFDTLRVWNEHQDTGEVKLSHDATEPTNLKKKFNVWRVNIPRDITPGADGKPVNYGMNRIRNPWAYINLKCSNSLADKHERMQFTDVLVNYFI